MAAGKVSFAREKKSMTALTVMDVPAAWYPGGLMSVDDTVNAETGDAINARSKKTAGKTLSP